MGSLELTLMTHKRTQPVPFFLVENGSFETHGRAGTPRLIAMRAEE